MENICEIKYNIKLSKRTFCNYLLIIDKQEITLSFPQLLSLRQKVNSLTHPEQLTNIIDNENFVLLFVADRKRLLYLDIPQLLDLKEEIECFFVVFS